MKAKIGSIPYILNTNFANILELYKTLRLDFSTEIGKRMNVILLGEEKEKYLIGTGLGKKTFVAFKLIEKDLQNPDIEAILFDLKIYVQEEKNKYYNFQPKGNFQIERAVLVDINSAYLTVLKKFDIISEKTFNYIQALPKTDRLAALGMLARRKDVFTYKEGELEFSDAWESENRYLFNFCIQQTHETMERVANVFKDHYLYFWVDGIYFSEGIDVQKVQQLISESGFNSKVKYLKDLYCRETFDTVFYGFREEKEKTFVQKNFAIPNEIFLREIRKTALNS